MVVLILAFGSVLAMGLPIAVALSGVAAGVAITLLLSNLYTVPDGTLTVGVDDRPRRRHRLRPVHRHPLPRAASTRAWRRGTPPVTAMGTAGRAVVFAGITVVVSLLGMLFIGIRLVTGVGLGASVTVLVTMVSSVTLLPGAARPGPGPGSRSPAGAA